ncbi:MAG: hypothetical protein HQ504_04965 [Rhodospirillaceae bacterium]|nr:hypothetical protein [Rhodospirillaceae bacterium]
MARYTSSYGSFVTRLEEVELLRKAAAKKELVDPVGMRDEINALCRGSIVLLSSHVEAYIKEVGELALESFQIKNVNRSKFLSRFFYHISKDILDDIKDTSDPDKIANKIFHFLGSDSNYWSKTGPFVTQLPSDRFNKGFSNPAFRKVKSYFNRFGYDNYMHDFYEKLRADALSTHNMLDHLVDTRNNIAHGDPRATKTPADLKEMIDMTTRFCRVTDEVFGNWCKTNFCSIR